MSLGAFSYIVPHTVVGSITVPTASLQFNKAGFDNKIEYYCFLYAVKHLNPNLYNWYIHTLVLPQTASVLCFDLNDKYFKSLDSKSK